MTFPVELMMEGGDRRSGLFVDGGDLALGGAALAAVEAGQRASGMDAVRLSLLWALVFSSAACDSGELIEVGCAKGGSGLVICKARTAAAIPYAVTLVDTFAGLVKAGDDDLHRNGEMADTDPQATRAFIEAHGERARVEKGVYPEDFEDAGARYRFAHIDVDTYQSAEDSFDYLLPRMVRGGLIVLDDYGVVTTPGITKFVTERLPMPQVRWTFSAARQAVAVVL